MTLLQVSTVKIEVQELFLRRVGRATFMPHKIAEALSTSRNYLLSNINNATSLTFSLSTKRIRAPPLPQTPLALTSHPFLAPS